MGKIKIGQEKITAWIKNNYWLVLILLSAFFVRCYGIYFDYPGGINYIWDETGALMQIFDIIQTKNLFSTTYHYPGLLSIFYLPILLLRVVYLMIVNKIFSFGEFKNFLLLDGMGSVYIIVRWCSVAFGTASVYLVYKIFNYIEKNKVAAYLAALTCSFSIIPVFLSHWGKAHSALVFFYLLSLYFSLLFEKEKKEKYFFWASFFAGCSISVHYLGIAAVIFPLLNIIFNRKNLNSKTIGKALLIGTLTVLFFYGLNYRGVNDMFVYQSETAYANTGYTGMARVSMTERLTYVLVDSWKIEPFLTSLLLILIFTCHNLWRNRFNRYLLVGILFYYFLMITIIVGPGNNRWLLIFMTLAYPLAVVALYNFFAGKNFKKFAIIISLLFIFPSLAYCCQWDRVAAKYSAVEAANWLEKNVDQKDWIYSFYYNLYLPLSYQAAAWNKENNQLDYKKIEYILSNPEIFKNSGYNLAYDYSNSRYKEFAGEQTKYVVISYVDKNGRDGQLNEIRKYHPHLLLDRTFSPLNLVPDTNIGDQVNNPDVWQNIFSYKMGGPFIDIYKVN